MTDATRRLSFEMQLFLAFALPLAVLAVHAYYYYPFFADDAFISLRYAQRLLQGHGLTWNDGEYVEGYSNLLWVLLISALGYLGFDLVAAARVVCLLSSIVAMLAFVHYQRHRMPHMGWPLFLTNLAFALTAPVAIWSLGGLETSLVMALLAWAYVLILPLLQAPNIMAAFRAGILLGLLCIARPEGAFFTMVMAAALLLPACYPHRRMLPSLMVLCIVPFLFFAAQVGFRLQYYGDWLPNSYYAKVALGTHARLMNGAMYVIKALASLLPLLLLIVMKIDMLRRPAYAEARRIICFFALCSLAWLVMLVLAGGDIFAGYRHILPVLPPLLLMTMETFAIAYDSGPVRNTHIFCGYLLACFLWLQCVSDENRNAKGESWEWQMKELGDWLRHEYQDTQPLIAVSNAGAIPYYSKLPSLDMYGINDSYLTHHRSKIFGEGFQGHELFDSDYVLTRKPDIVIFFTGVAKGVYGSDIAERPEFQASYRMRTVPLPSYNAVIWVRKDSEKVK